jgi:diamine N-acetyltransferase
MDLHPELALPDVTVRPVTIDNWFKVTELRPTPEQESAGFVAPNTFSLAQAWAEPWWRPHAIYAGDTLVGFVMFGRLPDQLPAYYEGYGVPDEHCILRFMVDGRYQRRGYGRAALQQVIAMLRAEAGSRAVTLSYELHNDAAAALYAGLGFTVTGRILDGEVEARLDLR